mmetsp:Transcript_26262/g.62352  ORF Transcript_26262/g.62352 Transcript_26262/m.62352 type:complete len:391 (+) Transcript_26262:766-1938(+)
MAKDACNRLLNNEVVDKLTDVPTEAPTTKKPTNNPTATPSMASEGQGLKQVTEYNKNGLPFVSMSEDEVREVLFQDDRIHAIVDDYLAALEAASPTDFTPEEREHHRRLIWDNILKGIISGLKTMTEKLCELGAGAFMWGRDQVLSKNTTQMISLTLSYVSAQVTDFIDTVSNTIELFCKKEDKKSFINIAKELGNVTGEILSNFTSDSDGGGLTVANIESGRKALCNPIDRSFLTAKELQHNIEYFKKIIMAFQRKGGVTCGGGVEVMGLGAICAAASTLAKEGGYVAELMIDNAKTVTDSYVGIQGGPVYTDLCVCFEGDNEFGTGSGCDGIDQNCDGMVDDCDEDRTRPALRLDSNKIPVDMNLSRLLMRLSLFFRPTSRSQTTAPT